MSEVPKYFQHVKDKGRKPYLHPFSYRSEDGIFLIADAEVSLLDFNPYTFNPYLPSLNIDPEGIEVDDMPNHPLMIPNFGKLLAGPKLHDWANTNQDEVANTRDVMKTAFSAFLDESELEEDNHHDYLFGFGAGLRQDGGVHLNVWGICACLGPDPNSYHIDNQFENGFAEYEPHNADSQMQVTSLYAGLGHIAHLASKF